jgi:hypothetical protein
MDMPIGCWFDNSRGIYLGEAVIRAAEERGFKFELSVSDYSPVDLTHHDTYLEVWEEAENYLNELAPEGYWFGCNESGDVGVWEQNEDTTELEDL